MSKTRGYSDAPEDVAKEIEASVPVKDFLPAPEVFAAQLMKQESVPVTMRLKKATLERYRRYAKKKGIKYQAFVSSLLDAYAERL